jgi:diguanylate cyclase
VVTSSWSCFLRSGKPDDAATVAHRIIEECSQPLSVRGKTVYLGASVGIAIFPNDGQDVVSLVKNADRFPTASNPRAAGVSQGRRYSGTVIELP